MSQLFAGSCPWGGFCQGDQGQNCFLEPRALVQFFFFKVPVIPIYWYSHSFYFWVVCSPRLWGKKVKELLKQLQQLHMPPFLFWVDTAYFFVVDGLHEQLLSLFSLLSLFPEPAELHFLCGTPPPTKCFDSLLQADKAGEATQGSKSSQVFPTNW